ncbi:hypothetical protein EI94DRAFT_1749892, partial [Lactarius quietus]
HQSPPARARISTTRASYACALQARLHQLVLDSPVPRNLLDLGAYPNEPEFTYMRYSAMTSTLSTSRSMALRSARCSMTHRAGRNY